VPHLCELYPGICLTTEGKSRENLNQGSRSFVDMPYSSSKPVAVQQQFRYNVTMGHVRETFVAVGKTIRITYSVCVSPALGIQHAMRMRHYVCVSPALGIQHAMRMRHFVCVCLQP